MSIVHFVDLVVCGDDVMHVPYCSFVRSFRSDLLQYNSVLYNIVSRRVFEFAVRSGTASLLGTKESALPTLFLGGFDPIKGPSHRGRGCSEGVEGGH